MGQVRCCMPVTDVGGMWCARESVQLTGVGVKGLKVPTSEVAFFKDTHLPSHLPSFSPHCCWQRSAI